MFKNIRNFIKKTVGYSPDQKTGKFGGTGSHIDDQEIQNEPNGYNSNQNVPFEVHPDGGRNVDLNAQTIERDIVDWHIQATQEILGNPQTVRPSKNAHRDIDQQLANQYYSNMETR